MAAPFDAHRLELTGPAVPLPERGLTTHSKALHDEYSAALTLSPDGTLVYVSPVAGRLRTVVWVDREGNETVFINVFLPTTPIPTSGLFLMVPEEDTTPMNCSVEEALKMVISGGAIISSIPAIDAAREAAEDTPRKDRGSTPEERGDDPSA